MTRPCNLLTPYVDGELEPDQAEVFALHLDGCATCPGALHEALQLLAIEAAARARPARTGAGDPPAKAPDAAAPDAAADGPIPITRGRKAPARARAPWMKLGIVVPAAAALVAYLAVPRLRGGGDSPVVEPTPRSATITTAPTRSVEGRISYRGASAHRPYSVGRAGDPVRSADAISLDTLARLEREGDLHGLAAAQLLLGDPARALAALERAGATTDVEADRALLLLASGKPADALVALDAILERAPDHPQARWNRALALRDLALPMMAADAFEAAAALGEPGWADEAKRRAGELAESVRGRKEAFDRLVGTDGPRLAAEPGAVTPEVARRFPGTARLFFYDAVRGAASAELVKQLAPLARELDAVTGGDHLARYVERAARADFARRRPFAARYAKLVAGQRLDAATGRAFVDELRAAGQDDLLLGALIRASTDGRTVPPPLLPELRRLAGATGNPWFELLATEQEAGALTARGELERAEVAVRRALATCDQTRLDFRCARLELELARSYTEANRLSDARRAVEAAWVRARRVGEWYVERQVLLQLAGLESLSGELGAATLAIARAYVGELARRFPERCADRTWGHELIAMMLVNRQDLAGARRELEAARGCAQARASMDVMFTKAHVLRDPSSSAAEVAALREEIAALRATVPPLARAFLDQAEGRLLVDRDRTAGTALLEHAIAAARTAPADDVFARKARSYAYAVLVLDAARAAEWERAWRLLGEEAGFAPAARCTAGVAVEDRRVLVVIRDAAGAVAGRYDAAGRAPAELFAELRGGLAACPSIEVVARAPVHGDPALLPADLAWSYRSGRAAPAPAAPDGGRLVIANPEPPAELGLPRLIPWRSEGPAGRTLAGPAATPSRALAELADASYVEIHVHGMVATAVADASFLMMSPEADGRYALTAAAIRGTALRGRPVVVLAACHAAKTAPFHHQPWSLPAAFVEAGSRAVIASTGVIDDADAGEFFDRLREELEHGAAPAIALRDTRARWLKAHPGASWVRSLMVFE